MNEVNGAENTAEVVKQAEDILAFAAIAEGHTKEELVEKALESFRITAHLVDLLRVLSVDKEGLTPVQQTMYDCAHSRKLREKARRAARVIVKQYDANVKSAGDELDTDTESPEV